MYFEYDINMFNCEIKNKNEPKFKGSFFLCVIFIYINQTNYQVLQTSICYKECMFQAVCNPAIYMFFV